MISFRYHLVSIIAVFLALALGIVVGTTALSGPVTTDLRHQLNSTRTQRDNLAQQVTTLQQHVDDAGEFAATYGAQLVTGTLAKRAVVIVRTPQVSDAVETGITRQITAAGGTVNGVLQLNPGYLAQNLGTGISNLATGSVHPMGLTLPPTDDARKLGAALLSYVLLGKGQSTDLTQVLGGLSALHMISVDAGSLKPATLFVVLASGTAPARNYGIGAETDLVSALVTTGGHVVVAADAASAAGGGLIATIRSDSTLRTTTSTVDDANNAFGQVSTVLAAAATAKGQNGHYGTEARADALFPAPGK